ncbi:hypothetical protein KFE80_00930 [bacterium SCSIO 12696]|nr:hypothetical protein KFE80_00930 [bacterium SCSIO 12696]
MSEKNEIILAHKKLIEPVSIKSGMFFKKSKKKSAFLRYRPPFCWKYKKYSLNFSQARAVVIFIPFAVGLFFADTYYFYKF